MRKAANFNEGVEISGFSVCYGPAWIAGAISLLKAVVRFNFGICDFLFCGYCAGQCVHKYAEGCTAQSQEDGIYGLITVSYAGDQGENDCCGGE